eukprot:scaffold24920_cov67-Phaeocystis_antarctica.AAC.1
MAGRESRKYFSTYESSLYVGSVPKVLLDRSRASGSAHGFQAVMSSLGPQIQAHAALGLPFTCPLKNAWPAEASSLASNPPKARRQRRRGRPRLSD